MLTNLLLFAGVSLVVIVTPGPDTALTVRNALFGRRSGILTAVGVGTGQLAWALLTACGVASMLAAHQGALTVLRLAGAAYLVGLGAHALWASWHSPSTTPPPRPRHGARRSFAQGLVSTLAQPAEPHENRAGQAIHPTTNSIALQHVSGSVNDHRIRGEPHHVRVATEAG
jgi:threonine/homoserine/homoserine lactone efflux protein